ncbi:hypothetical protein BC332_13944 [Capsicum chinense]|nr:hypothetical protein BC332_13944 [Capsicum chinense]
MEKNLEDAVKIGILYFIHTVVFSQLDKANIPARDFRMVDDESYSRFPWGKLAFAKLMDSFSRSMNEVQQYYRLNDMPHALQIWWYECCSEVNESITVRENNLIPRMVNLKLVYKNLSPSPQELNQLDLPNPLTFGLTDHGANVA